MKGAPLGTARLAAPLRESSSFRLTRLHTAVLEQAALEGTSAARADAKVALRRAELGYDPCSADFDDADPSYRAAYEAALAEIREERARCDRAAAVLLAVRRLRGKWLP